MTKHKKAETPKVLEPVVVTQTESIKAKDIALDIPQGHVLIVGLNEDGSEKQGSAFFYPQRSYKRIYGDETKYKVKKKAQ